LTNWLFPVRRKIEIIIYLNEAVCVRYESVLIKPLLWEIILRLCYRYSQDSLKTNLDFKLNDIEIITENNDCKNNACLEQHWHICFEIWSKNKNKNKFCFFCFWDVTQPCMTTVHDWVNFNSMFYVCLFCLFIYFSFLCLCPFASVCLFRLFIYFFFLNSVCLLLLLIYFFFLCLCLAFLHVRLFHLFVCLFVLFFHLFFFLMCV
jgi:hypothetical protein